MDSLSLIRIPKIHLPSPILPFNFDSGEQPDKPEPSVPIIPPSGSPSGGVSETFSNNGTNKKLNINNEFSDNDDRNEKQGHDQASRDIEENSNKNHVGESNDDQVKVLDTNTDDANEDFYSTQKNDKKRVKFDTSMRKRAKPDEKILLAINKIGGQSSAKRKV
ncbi:hypothetical protein GLOIN_2v1848653 [Rhizophagus clarus]|uniref:Uncharacterized protein n=1 Tax=Rhizophagus clarus TaxID=94130 RepID=A0A8H3LFU6_9GLOM|nr:hypothetical protein GLOIN_2v1848653 [Rhizophagus clarus]